MTGLSIDILEPTIAEADAKFADAYNMIYLEGAGKKQSSAG